MYRAFGFSNAKWSSLLRLIPGVFPPLGRVREYLRTLAPRAQAAVLAPRSNAEPRAFTSLGASLTRDLLLHPGLRDQRGSTRKKPKIIKIGTDGARDADEHDAAKTHLLSLTYAWVDRAVSANSVHTTGVIALAWAAEDVDSVYHACTELRAEMKQLRKNGLRVLGATYHFKFKVAADHKLLRLVLGMTPNGGHHPCPYCLCPAPDIVPSITDGKWRWDIPPKEMRTWASLKAAAKAAKPTRKRQRVTVETETYGQKETPAVKINTADCPNEYVHTRMRVTELLLRLRGLVRDAHAPVPASGGKKKPSLFKDEELKAALGDIGVNFFIRGLTGGQCTKILEQREAMCASLPRDSEAASARVAALQLAMQRWHELNGMSHLPLERHLEYRDAARTFGSELCAAFTASEIGHPTYLHIAVNHGHWFMPHADYSTQAVERLHKILKDVKHDHTVQRKGATVEQLVQILNTVNERNVALAVAAMTPKQNQRCRVCGEPGHNKRKHDARRTKQQPTTESKQGKLLLALPARWLIPCAAGRASRGEESGGRHCQCTPLRRVGQPERRRRSRPRSQ